MNMAKKAKADTTMAILIKQPEHCLTMPLQRTAKVKIFIERALPVTVSQWRKLCWRSIFLSTGCFV